jgi:hypothetical protein
MLHDQGTPHLRLPAAAHAGRGADRITKMGELSVLAPDGTQKLTWDPLNPGEALSIKKHFDQFLDNGYSAFILNESGGEGKKISAFDVSAQKIILVPKLGGG